jgi:hypothetical protein
MTIKYASSEERQCHGKRTYLNSGDAKRAAKHAMTKHGGGKLSQYHCVHCGRWHLGHTPKWRKMSTDG